jgi:hypothetical protein
LAHNWCEIFSISRKLHPRIIIEGFWHAKGIEERAIATQTMQVKYEVFDLSCFFVNFLKLSINIEIEYHRVLISYIRCALII